MDKNAKKIIIFENNHVRKGYLKTILSREGYIVFSFDSIANCIDNLDQLDADLMVLGTLENEQLMMCINALMAVACRLPLLILSDNKNLGQYLTASQFENADIVDNTYDLAMFQAAVRSALNKKMADPRIGFSSFLVGSSAELMRIKQKLPELGRLNESILLTGEPGTGKESVARAVHGASGQDNGRFIKVDAAHLRCDDAFSLLFEFNKRQLQPEADPHDLQNGDSQRWTIYLEETGRLPEHLQAELLLITGTRNDQFRILAGTSQDLKALVAERRFRKDLYYRLNVLHLNIPPLRHRREDIPLLTDFFSYKFCREFDKVILPISSRLKGRFLQYGWPGNIRELRDIVKRIVLKGEKNSIVSNIHPRSSREASRIKKKWARELVSIEQMTNKKEYLGQVGEMALKKICLNFMAKVEKQIMQTALESTNWNRRKAAAMLSISYKSMLNKIKTYGLA
ncbi:MAG: sigma-54-dependent Fis family transcriptional regulator [Deltaproteobacteria bacterium]|nr:sigma-54-dependent Fis family transcriptional regulator [Deltaproteobacteria bacterium]MBW2614255.1 sigma-54-dependent Fis family transcriptional regulator [Deltaproteobacteria bacterium]MBW2633265.1 sigma-54-dependent Fis family transcriptional regulator [Deltaproteobacteria bacterium]